jgi:hypothetical protein
MQKILTVLPIVIVLACSSAPVPPSTSEAVATASIEKVTPPSGSIVTANQVIEAEIQYVIENFDPRTEYYLAPLFASNQGSGTAFNSFDRITDGWRLTQPSGRIRVRYPVAREWRSPMLAKPVRMNFKIMVRTGRNSTTVIGETEVVTYRPVV